MAFKIVVWSGAEKGALRWWYTFRTVKNGEYLYSVLFGR